MELNERLRELRKEQGETQKQVAAAIGIGERPYQYLESGEHRPSLDTLIALADHFGVSLDYLAATLHGRAKLLYGGWREMVPACLRGLANGRGGVRYRLER